MATYSINQSTLRNPVTCNEELGYSNKTFINIRYYYVQRGIISGRDSNPCSEHFLSSLIKAKRETEFATLYSENWNRNPQVRK